MSKVNAELAEIGIIGLGVMGRNLLLNMADHGFTVAGYDKDSEKVKSLQSEAGSRSIYDSSDLKTFIGHLKKPRAILLLVPAGAVVDSVIQELLPVLEPGDLIIDAGNSYFKDTDRRTKALLEKQLKFLGIGISGGEKGARHGPSIMPGGNKETYKRIQTILEAIAAKVNNEPCVRYLGLGSSGHFVKMVHNGIEYGIMQLIAESYDILKRGLGLGNDRISKIYYNWNQGILNSYLIEITAHIFNRQDEKTKNKLIDSISDVARQLGTGMWTSQIAMELQVPAPTIDVAVSMRDLSVLTKERSEMYKCYELNQSVGKRLEKTLEKTASDSSIPRLSEENSNGWQESFINDLEQALYTGIIMVYAQGMAILKAGSDKYGYELNLEAIAKIWRGGCIIRAAVLEEIAEGFHKNNQLSNLLLDPQLSPKIAQYQNKLRHIISKTVMVGIPIPALMSGLSYFDAFRSGFLPSNLVQAQRDYFGSHTYERTDIKGSFHTEWEEK